jgi:hypothetical protein
LAIQWPSVGSDQKCQSVHDAQGGGPIPRETAGQRSGPNVWLMPYVSIATTVVLQTAEPSIRSRKVNLPLPAISSKASELAFRHSLKNH